MNDQQKALLAQAKGSLKEIDNATNKGPIHRTLIAVVALLDSLDKPAVPEEQQPTV